MQTRHNNPQFKYIEIGIIVNFYLLQWCNKLTVHYCRAVDADTRVSANYSWGLPSWSRSDDPHWPGHQQGAPGVRLRHGAHLRAQAARNGGQVRCLMSCLMRDPCRAFILKVVRIYLNIFLSWRRGNSVKLPNPAPCILRNASQKFGKVTASLQVWYWGAPHAVPKLYKFSSRAHARKNGPRGTVTCNVASSRFILQLALSVHLYCPDTRISSAVVHQ